MEKVYKAVLGSSLSPKRSRRAFVFAAWGVIAFMCASATALGSDGDQDTGDEDAGSGAVVVVTPEGEPMPGLHAIASALDRFALKVQASKTEYVHASSLRLVAWREADALGFAPKALRVRACEETRAGVPPGSAPAIDGMLKEAERLIMRASFDAADARLEQAWIAELCSRTPVERATLFRIHFLRGINAYFAGRKDEALDHFRDALGIHPEGEWDRNYPPAAWELFVQAKSEHAESADILLRVASAGNHRFTVDGAPIRDEGVEIKAGVHLLQRLDDASKDDAAQAVLGGWELTVQAEDGFDRIWILDDKPGGWDEMWSPETARWRVDALTAWARHEGHHWIVILDALDETHRPLFIDVDEGATAPVPDWLGSAAAGPGVRHLAHDWGYGLGITIAQDLAGQLRAYGVEAELIRTVIGPWDVVTALSFGSFGPSGGFSSFRVSARYSHPLNAFIFAGELGLVGCACGGKASLGVDARAGMSYVLDRKGKRALEIGLGLGAYPAQRFVPGRTFLHYHRAF